MIALASLTRGVVPWLRSPSEGDAPEAPVSDSPTIGSTDHDPASESLDLMPSGRRDDRPTPSSALRSGIPLTQATFGDAGVAGPGPVMGHVLDEEGEPIAAASLRFEQGATVREVRSDASGLFRFVPERTGRWSLTDARAVGFEPWGRRGAELTIEARPGLGVDGLVLRLVRDRSRVRAGEAIVTGTVRGEGGPLAGAQVDVLGADGLGAVTDEAGRYSLGLAPGPARLRARARGHGHETRMVSAPYDGADFRLGPESLVRGRVVTERGAPVQAFAVQVSAVLGPGARQERALAFAVDGEGHFEVGGLAGGRYVLVAYAEGYTPSEAAEVVLRPTDPAEVGDLVLTRGGAIAGRVTGPDDAPVAGARVRLEHDTPAEVPAERFALTDGDGRYFLELVPPGRHSVLVEAPRERNFDRRIISGVIVMPGEEQNVDVALEAASGDEPGLTMAGIGAVIRVDRRGPAVQRLVPGGGGDEAGLQPGDVLLRVDAQPLDGLSFLEVIEKIRGPAGTSVILELRRGDQPMTFEVTRGTVRTP